MNAERLLVWAAAVAAVAVFSLSDAVMGIKARLAVAALAVVVVAPLVAVFLGWLSAVRDSGPGWS